MRADSKYTEFTTKVPRGFLLKWSKYKSYDDSLTVWFPGGLQVTVHRHDREWRLTKTWSVWFGSGKKDRIPGLTDRRYRTRMDAMRAMERYFVPVIKLATRMLRANVTVEMDAGMGRTPPKKPTT